VSSILARFEGPDIWDDQGNPKEGVTDDQIALANKEQREATGELVPILYETFQLHPIDPKTGEGTTEKEIIDAFYAFINFQSEVKKNIETSPNSPSSTPDNDSGSTEATTNDSAVSTGIASDPSQSVP